MEIGGLAKTTFNRANLLTEHGYDITLLNIDKLKNCEYITEHFHKNKYLNESIDIINIYDYISQRYTLDKSISPDIETEDYTLEKDHSKTIKSKRYFNNYYCIETYDEDNLLNREDLYTNDGFKFLSINHERKHLPTTLTDRKLNLNIEFESIFDFHTYVIQEILLKYDNKAFLINENSGIVPNFNDIDSNLAYKIASIHTNPYSGEHHYGSQIRGDFVILKNVNKLDYIVVLTEGLKNDLTKEFNISTIKAIPNIINLEEYNVENENKKDSSKFSIFARLSPEKNISEAIKAFEIVSKQNKNAKLEIFGRAVTPSEILEEKRLKELVSELNLESSIIFKGHTDNVSQEMQKSLATLFTSKFEGLGMVVLESMLNQTPVISYDLHYGPSDFIINDENGFLVDERDIEKLAEKMLYLLNNPQKAIEMGIKAREKITKELGKENLFLKWENVLKECYINSQKSINTDLIDTAILNELVKSERIKIKLYRQNHRLYRQNKFLKQQIDSKGSIKNLFKKIKLLK